MRLTRAARISSAPGTRPPGRSTACARPSARRTTVTDIKRLTAPFPESAHKQRTVGGGKSLTYIEGHTVILRLNDATENHWDFAIDRIERTEIDQNNALIMAYVTLTL